jgi:hypothetical protein
MTEPQQQLLSVDLGIRTGFALYDQDCRLHWYRSQNFGNRSRLKKNACNMLKEIEGLAWLIIEGGGDLAEVWRREAERRDIAIMQVSAETWRRVFLYPREQKKGVIAKLSAEERAREIIEWLGLSRPTSLRHDAAEAILIGLWGLKKVGWLEELPEFLKL